MVMLKLFSPGVKAMISESQQILYTSKSILVCYGHMYMYMPNGVYIKKSNRTRGTEIDKTQEKDRNLHNSHILISITSKKECGTNYLRVY